MERKRLRQISLAAVLILCANLACAQEANLLPKYGGLPKTEALKEADKIFIAGMEKDYHGDRKKAAADMAARGWQYLAAGDPDGAMRRFNQAWLLDKKNGNALWGMAAIEASAAKFDASLGLFAEAEKYVGGEINFQVDFAKALGMAGVKLSDETLLKFAFNRFEFVYKKAPQNTLNLQNWAKTLFGAGNYPEAWAKVKLAEATPNKGNVDPQLVADLEARMPRPQD